MDQSALLGQVWRISHRHGDDWVRLERRPHDAAETDPERQWGRGALYQCPHCEEQVLIETEDEERPPHG